MMNHKKRPLPETTTQSHHSCCSFCPATPVILIEYSNKKNDNHDRQHRNVRRGHHQNLKSPPNQPLCLLHFYTTDACHTINTNRDSKQQQYTTATILDSIAMQQQLPSQQELFAEAYLQIQQQIQDAIQQQQQQQQQEVLAATTNVNDDPLAIITDLNNGYSNMNSPQKFQPYDSLKAFLPRRKKLNHTPPIVASPEGGFLRHVPIPERIIQVQQQQVQQQKELIARMNQSSNEVNDDIINNKSRTSYRYIPNTADATQRRKPTRTNVWNIISQEDRNHATTTTTSTRPLPDDVQQQQHLHDTSVVCTCGSTTVEVLSSNTNKSQDMTKAETWGNKDRHDEIINRYLCHRCGKSWNDVE